MQKEDFETGKTLLNPYVEIKRMRDNEWIFHINVSTFGKCLEHLMPPFTESEPNLLEESDFVVYGSVGRTVVNSEGNAYLKINEPTISRTLMGFLSEKIVKEKLPEVYKFLRKE